MIIRVSGRSKPVHILTFRPLSKPHGLLKGMSEVNLNAQPTMEEIDPSYCKAQEQGPFVKR